MNLCSEGHDEVCYEGKTCPACQIIDKLTDEISGLERDIERLDKEE